MPWARGESNMGEASIFSPRGFSGAGRDSERKKGESDGVGAARRIANRHGAILKPSHSRPRKRETDGKESAPNIRRRKRKARAGGKNA